eukprot:INCI10399.3.p1 GENE.INCI10399.3~~INCI10399.3.p1  ORF type:complete len:166 (-),score=29.71 INCI10399.3:32-529(-)
MFGFLYVDNFVQVQAHFSGSSARDVVMNPLVHALVRQLATLQAESVASGNEEVGLSLENLIRLIKSGAVPKAETHPSTVSLNSFDSLPAASQAAVAPSTTESTVVGTNGTEIPTDDSHSPRFAATPSSENSGTSQTVPEELRKPTEAPPLPSTPKSSTSGETAAF